MTEFWVGLFLFIIGVYVGLIAGVSFKMNRKEKKSKYIK